MTDHRATRIEGVLRGRLQTHEATLLALEALASLARDARKAALAEAVVEELEAALREYRHINLECAGTCVVERRVVASDFYGPALAAFRAEFPAEPRDTTSGEEARGS